MTAANPAPVRIVAFGYGHGDAPAAHLTLDLRAHFRLEMREPTAAHRKVRRAVLGTPGLKALLTATVRAVQAYDAGPSAPGAVVAVGCTGRNLSAVAAHALARRLRRRGHEVTVEHRPVIAR